MWILCNQEGEKQAYLKPHDSIQQPRVSAYGLNSSGVLHDRPLEKSLTVVLDGYYHELTQVADKYHSHYKRGVKSSGPLLLQDNARKHTIS